MAEGEGEEESGEKVSLDYEAWGGALGKKPVGSFAKVCYRMFGKLHSSRHG